MSKSEKDQREKPKTLNSYSKTVKLYKNPYEESQDPFNYKNWDKAYDDRVNFGIHPDHEPNDPVVIVGNAYKNYDPILPLIFFSRYETSIQMNTYLQYNKFMDKASHIIKQINENREVFVVQFLLGGYLRENCEEAFVEKIYSSLKSSYGSLGTLPEFEFYPSIDKLLLPDNSNYLTLSDDNEDITVTGDDKTNDELI